MMPDLEFGILGIPDAPGALADHAETDVASLDPGPSYGQ